MRSTEIRFPNLQNEDSATEHIEANESVSIEEIDGDLIEPAFEDRSAVSASGRNPQLRAREVQINKLIAKARELGVSVDDDRANSSGQLWIKIKNSKDASMRMLIRKLVNMGFEYWPGRGYWR